MSLLFCNKCGNRTKEGEDYACGCASGLGGERLPVTQYQITEKMRDNVAEHLSNLQLLGENFEDPRSLGQMLAGHESSVELANEDVANVLLKMIKDSVADPEKIPVGSKHYYNTRPWCLTAASMTSQSYFEDSFNNSSQLLEMNNPESKCIDYLLGDHFRSVGASPEESLQQRKAVQLEEGHFAPIYALPDGLLTHEGQEYVLEFKTVRKYHSMIKYNKLKEWLYQLAAYQLGSYDDVVALNTVGTPLPADNKKYLLVVVLLGSPGPRLIVLQATPENVSRCTAEWLQWFEARAKPANDVKYLNKYFRDEIPFSKIKAVSEEYKERERAKKEAEEGWTVEEGKTKLKKKKGGH